MVNSLPITAWTPESMGAWGPETLPETIESGPLCITDLFQNKPVAYF